MQITSYAKHFGRLLHITHTDIYPSGGWANVRAFYYVRGARVDGIFGVATRFICTDLLDAQLAQ